MTMFCLKFVRFMIYFWLPLYLKKVLGYTNLQSGFLSTMFDIGNINYPINFIHVQTASLLASRGSVFDWARKGWIIA